jgi:AcrR family transcriptional regulator
MAAQRAQGARRKQDGLREAQRRFTRQHILDAATEVFIERGYIASTVEHIIERAGTSRGTFYSYFRSKTDVIAELNAALAPQIHASYSRLDDALHARSPEALREWFSLTIEWCVRDGGLMPVWEQARATEPEQNAQRQEFLRSVSDSMPHYLARWPTENQDEARLRIVLLSVQLDAFFLHSPPRDMDAADRTLVAHVLTNIWYESLQAPPLPDTSERTDTATPAPTGPPALNRARRPTAKRRSPRD